jgi:hypothetical protein
VGGRTMNTKKDKEQFKEWLRMGLSADEMIKRIKKIWGFYKMDYKITAVNIEDYNENIKKNDYSLLKNISIVVEFEMDNTEYYLNYRASNIFDAEQNIGSLELSDRNDDHQEIEAMFNDRQKRFSFFEKLKKETNVNSLWLDHVAQKYVFDVLPGLR